MICLFLVGCVFSTATVAEESDLLSLNAGIDQLALQLTRKIADRYFNADKKPLVRVAFFDFVDAEGNITVGSRYVSTRLRLAFAEGLQFELLPVQDFEKRGVVLTPKEFSNNVGLKEQLMDEFRADVYIFGTVAAEGDSNEVCKVTLWGIAPPYENWYTIESLDVENPLPWKLAFSPSGSQFFKHVTMEGASGVKKEIKGENLGKVIFLTQPICDDLNLSWQIKADGMVYDLRKIRDIGSLRNRTGGVFQSRVKSRETLKELSYVIQDCALIIREQDGNGFKCEPYVIPEESDYFFLPISRDETGLRFQYIWGRRGLSKRPSSIEGGKGWKLNMAQEDYDMILPVGANMATAVLSPIAESLYGSKTPRADYVIRFKFLVKPGLNIYVINFEYKRDWPEIYVRRLEIEETRDIPKIKSIRKITEVYRVYGEETGEED